MKQLLFLFVVLCITACHSAGKKTPAERASTSDTIRYAKGFTVAHFTDYTAVEVRDPWDSTRLLQRYLLVDRNVPVPGGLPKGTIIQIPVRNVVVYTSVHAAIINELNETDQIIGVCEPRYMDIPAVQEGLRAGRIADLGEATSPNVEKMIDIGAEVIIVSPFQNSSYGPAGKLGLPIIECADYMEALPLGRTEWGIFYGMLFGKEAMADSIFRATEHRYLELKELVARVSDRPTMIPEKKYGSSWYMPAGDSYMAHIYKDAGVDYLFKELPGAGSTPLAFETVLDQGIHADYWLIKYNQATDMTYDELRTEYAPYANFDAWKNRRIYGCNTGKVPFYEEIPMHPDYLLKDLVWVFHPELLPDYAPRYFKAL